MKQFQEKPWLVSDGYVKRRISLSNVEYIEADRMYAEMHGKGIGNPIAGKNEETLSLACPLGTLEKELPEEMFVRVSRSPFLDLIWMDIITFLHYYTIFTEKGVF